MAINCRKVQKICTGVENWGEIADLRSPPPCNKANCGHSATDSSDMDGPTEPHIRGGWILLNLTLEKGGLH